MFFIIDTDDTSRMTSRSMARRFAVPSTCCRTPSRGPGSVTLAEVTSAVAPGAARLGDVEALRRVKPDAAAAFRSGMSGVRWPLLFFAVCARIHLEGLSPAEALASVIG